MNIKNLKLYKKISAMLLATTMSVSLTGCYNEEKNKDSNNEIVNEQLIDDVSQELSSEYHFYYDDSPFYKVNREGKFTHSRLAYTTFESFIGGNVSLNNAKHALQEINFDPDAINKANELCKKNDCKLISYDEESILLFCNKNNSYSLLDINGKHGKSLCIYDSLLDNFKDLDLIVTYSNNQESITCYERKKSKITFIDNSILIGNDGNEISFIKLSDQQHIYHYDMTSGKETKEPINKENQNYWLELADGSIMYIKKDGSFARYENNYKIEYGSLEDNSCILSNLNYYSKKGNYNLKSYNPTYFNNNQDCEIELEFFKKITDYREEKGYLKYMGENNREYFVDITTQKKYYASNDTLKAKDYSLYTVKGIPNVSSSSQIIKNKDGKTVYINRSKPIVKYFDDTNTAIAGDLFRDNEYRNVKLLSMDDIANPVFIKGGKFIRLTSNKNVLIITYKNEKKQLINSEGKTITKCYDVISETKYNDSVWC